MGAGRFARDLCSIQGVLKICEIITIFMTLVIHRHGDHGHYLFFSSTNLKLNYADPAVDVENLGNSTLVTFMIISIVMTIGYLMDGAELIQATILETIWNFLGMCMFLGSGAMAIMTWKDETIITSSVSSNNAGRGQFNEAEFSRDVRAGLAMGSLCVLCGIFYMVDFIMAWASRRRIIQKEDY